MKDCYDHDSHAGLETKPQEYTSEHQKIRSRLDGRMHEISFQPLPAAPDPSKGGEIPANPFVSTSQSRYMYAHPEILGKKGLKEWSHATNYSLIPNKVKK